MLVQKGQLKINKVKAISENEIEVAFIYDKKPIEEEYIRFHFDKQARVNGIMRNDETPALGWYEPIDSTIALNEQFNMSLDQLFKFNEFHGCVAMVNKGTEIFRACRGYSDFENQIPINDSSMFDLASCSKQFTATAIMLLYQQGKLSVSDMVSQYIPNFPYKKITIAHLLTHTSGLQDYLEVMEDEFDETKMVENKDILGLVINKQLKQSGKPGTYFSYSNTGYVLLGTLVEKISGQSFEEFLKDNIFNSLDMNKSRVYTTRRSGEFIENYAYVYSDRLRRYVIPDSLKDYNEVIQGDKIFGDGVVSSTIFRYDKMGSSHLLRIVDR
jgi:hypothetical protein